MTFDWMATAERLRAMAQTGLTYASDRFDRMRYEELERLAHGMLAELLGSSPEAVGALYALDKGYPTPKVDVRTAVFRDGRVLLVQEWIDGLWTLPGGWADEGDAPREAAERECREESGYEVRVEKLIALKDRRRHVYVPRTLGGTYKLFFLASLTGGEARTSEETLDVGFFALDELPPLSLARTLPEDIREAYRHWLNPALPPHVD